MSFVRSISVFSFLFLLNFASASFALAANDVPTRPYPNSWCYGMPWTSFGWVFPVMFFIMMIVIFILFMRRRGMGCGWRNWMSYGPEYRENMGHSFDQQSDSAMEILNKRYAKGEIDKQEYEEKKAAISSVYENNKDL
jgi:putative membrane protein